MVHVCVCVYVSTAGLVRILRGSIKFFEGVVWWTKSTNEEDFFQRFQDGCRRIIRLGYEIKGRKLFLAAL